MKIENLEIKNEILDLQNQISQIMLKIYPIGCIYMSVSSTNPSTLFGGTWVAWGSGKVPVGVNTDDTNFDEVEKTGGEKSHTLSVAEMAQHTHSIPAHSHGLNNHTHTVKAHNHTFSGTTEGNGAAQSNKITLTYPDALPDNWGNEGKILGGHTGNKWAFNATFVVDIPSHTHKYSGTTSTLAQFNTGASSGNTANSSALTSGSSGSGNAHNNLQPYIVCYMWKRTA